jgi:cellulose biosynthesis protein BcsQ
MSSIVTDRLVARCLQKVAIMKIKLAILDREPDFLERLASAFNARYWDKLEIYSFTQLDTALSELSEARIDVFLADESFEIDLDKIPTRCGFAYFVENPQIASLRDQPAISKYQKADSIYKQILSIYAEKSSDITGFKSDGTPSALISVFASPAGGVGSSTLSAAYALTLARAGRRVLYMNLELFGRSDVFFTGAGQETLSDVIFVLKSQKLNLSVKLESAVRESADGVFFFESPPIALDVQELTQDDLERLLRELRARDRYDHIVLDMDFALDGRMLHALKEAYAIVLVSDGMAIANTKLVRAYEALRMIDQQRDLRILSKLYLVYNKFSNKVSQAVEGIELRLLGGAPRYAHASQREVVEQLVSMNIFRQILR